MELADGASAIPGPHLDGWRREDEHRDSRFYVRLRPWRPPPLVIPTDGCRAVSGVRNVPSHPAADEVDGSKVEQELDQIHVPSEALNIAVQLSLTPRRNIRWEPDMLDGARLKWSESPSGWPVVASVRATSARLEDAHYLDEEEDIEEGEEYEVVVQIQQRSLFLGPSSLAVEVDNCQSRGSGEQFDVKRQSPQLRGCVSSMYMQEPTKLASESSNTQTWRAHQTNAACGDRLNHASEEHAEQGKPTLPGADEIGCLTRQDGRIMAKNAAREAQSVVRAPNRMEVMVGEEGKGGGRGGLFTIEAQAYGCEEAATLEEHDRSERLLGRLLQEQGKDGTGIAVRSMAGTGGTEMKETRCSSMSWVARLLHMAGFDWFLPKICESSGNISFSPPFFSSLPSIFGNKI